MKKLINWIVLIGVIITFGVCLTMMRRVTGYTSQWFALLVISSFLGVVAFARPLFLLRLPVWLRPVRPWEMQGRFYQALGVPAFGVLLRRTPLRYLQPLVYLRKNPKDLPSLLAQLEGAEAAHLWAAALAVPYMIYASIRHWWAVVFWFSVLQIIGNLYPIWHLRWSRCRLELVFGKKRHGYKNETADAHGHD